VAIRASESKLRQLCLTWLISVSDLSLVVISPRRRNAKISLAQLSAMPTDHDSDTPDDGLGDDDLESTPQDAYQSQSPIEVPLPDGSIALGTLRCDQGCGRFLEEELGDDQTTCLTCMNELQGDNGASWDSYD